MHRPTMFAAVMIGALGLSPAMAQQAPRPMTEAAFAAQTCAVCHGGPGNNPPTMPAIHGADAKAIYDSLIDLKTNKRPSTIMGRIARGYSDDQLKAVAEYLSRY